MTTKAKRFVAHANVAEGLEEQGIEVTFTDTEGPTNAIYMRPMNFRSIESFDAFTTALKRGGIEVDLT